jgi:hypothetical protein
VAPDRFEYDDPQAYGPGACGRCRALVALADAVTRRRRPDPTYGPTLAHLFRDALGTGLCGAVGLRFRALVVQLEALCDRVLDGHLDSWAAGLASYRAARDKGLLGGQRSASSASLDGDGWLDEALAAKLCGAESANLCTAADVEAIMQAQELAQASAQAASPPAPPLGDALLGVEVDMSAEHKERKTVTVQVAVTGDSVK